MLLTIGLCFKSQAGMPVIDAANLSENLMLRIMSIQQWLEDNTHQIDQLDKLKENLNLDEDRFALDKKNSLMPNLNLWQETSKLSDRTLSLVSASSDLWGEMGDLASYVASFQKSQAWQKCFTEKGSVCGFAEYLAGIDENVIDTARVAMQNAEAMQYKIKNDVRLIKSMMEKAQDSEGLGDTLDALSRISTMTQGSLSDLNGQFTQLISLLGTTMAKESQQKLVINERKKAFFDEKAPYQEDFHFDLKSWKEGVVR